MSEYSSRTCGTCRFWSDLCARSRKDFYSGADVIEALCLNALAKRSGAYTRAEKRCPQFEAGEPVDLIEAERKVA